MKRKAKFIKAVYDTNPYDKHYWEYTELLYEYKGYEYFVTAHHNGYEFDSLYQQHKEAQAQIDEMIKNKNKPVQEWKYNGSAQEGLDAFFDAME